MHTDNEILRTLQIVGRWADKLGTELWELANEVGRPEELLEEWDPSSMDGNFTYVPSNLNYNIKKENSSVYSLAVFSSELTTVLPTAKTTVSSILDTLSNNDFVTLLKYSNDTSDMVPCFKDMLIQATPENLETFKKSMDNVKPEGIANLTTAFTAAFSLLKTYREIRGYDADVDADTPYNQLIMLVTDGVPGNLTEVFQKWNWRENSTHIPVRVFTYLLGREVTKVREIQWMACLNRGYYRHVRTQEEVREQVLKYIPVVARPLVLQGVVHPITWTHVYADVTVGSFQTLQEFSFRFDPSRDLAYLVRQSIGKRRMKLSARLLGRQSSDKCVRGVLRNELANSPNNATYIIVIVNGSQNPALAAWLWVVMKQEEQNSRLQKHLKGKRLGVRVNEDAIYIQKVENLDKNENIEEDPSTLNTTAWQENPGPEILELRSALVDHKRGSMRNIPVKLHYDDNRRVTLERRDYFYAPLPGTPFGLAVAIPHYGTTWIKVGDEIRRNQHMNVNVSDFFKGDHWRVHPSWVYCRYHYLEGHRFDSPEDELRHFLALLSRSEWRWAEQYEAYPPADENADGEDLDDVDCGRQTLSYEDYYCNKELMQLLVFDAKATNNSFRGDYIEDLPARAKDLARLYGIFLRFIATQSGLTRWHHLHTNELPDADDGIVFGDLHRRAVNEPWYKGAIFQNELDLNSIYLSVPWEAGADAVVTASMSLSPKDGGKRAPAAVVGFQMPMTGLYRRFIELTSRIDNSANSLMEPLQYVWELLFWLMLRLAWFSTQFVNLPGIHGKVYSDEDAPDPPPPPEPYLYHYPCDQKRTLYMLNETVASKGVTNHSDYHSRPYYAQRVAHTNLLLVVVDSMYPTCYRRLEVTPVNIDPTEYTNGMTEKPCHKIPLNALKRRRLKSCFTEHCLEHEIDDCGGASGLTMSLTSLLCVVIITILCTFL
ncbi:Voltage-dependent calcium channel subunit alpha-2/delta-4 [Harpegnathos saltator]|uniref:Voltage-dependent calcium channel subunit alpha-2/delta-4 n=1 Tax=Harpegnathos saltator TaxID=610380 RepID=E2BCM0_HARSA|nr:Voltage-dependent calcium channel subunit alpha-2/delta-4 [Harpegnathos saltator]